MSKPNPRRSNGSKRTKLRRQVAAEGAPCHLCGGPIDYALEPGHPMCFELDEIVPVSLGGDPLDRSNLAPAHRLCNQKRGNKLLELWFAQREGEMRTEAERTVSGRCSRDW